MKILIHIAGVFNCVVCSSEDNETTTDWLNENRKEKTEWRLVSRLMSNHLPIGKCPHSERSHFLFNREKETQ